MCIRTPHCLLTLLLMIGSHLLNAQSNGPDSLRQTMTTYLQYDIGSNTYESDTAASKESSQSDTFTLGTAAGYERLIGVSLRSSRNSVDFDLNGSSMNTRWQDLMLSYRLGWFTPAIGAGLSEIQIETANNEYVDIYRASLGAGLGLHIPLWQKMVISGDFRFFEKPPTPRFDDLSLTSADAIPEGTPVKLDAQLQSRSDLDIGMSVDISREFLDFVIGYRIKSYELLVENEKKSEYQTGLYVGFKLGAYF